MQTDRNVGREIKTQGRKEIQTVQADSQKLIQAI